MMTRRSASRSHRPATAAVFPTAAALPAFVAALAALAVAAPSLADETATSDAGETAAADPFAAVGAIAVDAIYRPAHAAFADAADTLDRHVTELCAEPGENTLEPARVAFADAVAHFSPTELLRAGPLLDDNRLNRLFYWPDTRRAGERQLNALLAESPADIDAVEMSARSVAVQGLPALERLLHGNAAGVLAGSGTDPSPAGRCRVAAAVAGNVAAIATTLDEAWSSEDGIASQMRSPRAGDPLFRTNEEVARRLMTQLETGLGILVERKVGPLLDTDPPSLRGAPFARSGETWTNLAGNIESLRALAIDTGLAERAGLENEVSFEFRVAAAHTARLAELATASSSSDTLDEEQIGVLRALALTLASIRTTLNERLLPNLGIRTGFNAEDGD